jgi:exopolyphosphatase/guanosine-5'-triphosphate,3'-diphosphate pyrophosphatase
MKVAIIDLGTNTFHLLIASLKDNVTNIIYKTNVPVRLGEDITKANTIIPIAFERGITCLQDFKKTIDVHKVDKVKAIATSGVRSATNGSEFVKAAKELAGITIDIIDGDQEASYIYQGVSWSGAIIGRSLIMDIGGGSTEFILCDATRMIWKKSYNIGAARLMQAFFQSDPINAADQWAITQHLNGQLEELITICNVHQPQTLIGSAGAFETFHMMINGDLPNQIADIPYTSYKRLSQKLIAATHAQRAQMEGLIPLRVDMIVMAALLTDYILERLTIKQLTLSTYDLKMGVLSSQRAQ